MNRENRVFIVRERLVDSGDAAHFGRHRLSGPRRFDYPVSIGLIDERGARHVALDGRPEALEKRMNQLV